MNLKYIVTLSFLIFALQMLGMDVDYSPNPEKSASSGSEAPSPDLKNFLYLKTDDGSFIQVPADLLKYFQNKIEIANEITDDMVLNFPMLTEATVEKVFALLRLNNVNTIREEIAKLPTDELIAIANASMLLDLPILKDALKDLFSKLDLTKSFDSREYAMETLHLFDALDNFYINIIRRNLFGDFKSYLRDKNPFFESKVVVLAQIPPQTDIFCFAGNGTSCAWVDEEKDFLHIENFPKKTTKTIENIGFRAINFPSITLDHMGSTICLVEKGEIKIFNTRTYTLRSTEIPGYVTKQQADDHDEDDVEIIIPNHNGTLFFVALGSECWLCKLNQQTGFIQTFDKLKFSHNPNIEKTPDVSSACFSRDGNYLYVLYDDFINGAWKSVLCIYATGSSVLVIKKEIPKEFKFIAATQRPHELFVGSDHTIKKYTYNQFESTVTELPLNIALEGSALYGLQSNDTDTFLIAHTANGFNLINATTQTIECEYSSISHAVFGMDQKSLVGLKRKETLQGLKDVIYIPFRPPSVNNALDDIMERLSLIQLFTLQQLEEELVKNPDSPKQPIIDFIQKIPESIRGFIRTYIFNDVVAADEILIRPAKKQKTSHKPST